MQRITSEWVDEVLEVDDEIPTVALRHILGGMHVYTPDNDVVREITDRTSKHGYNEHQLSQTIAAALYFHRENRAVYVSVMSGSV